MSEESLKWIKAGSSDSFFVNESTNQWIEFENGSKHSKLNEIKRYHDNGLVVLLKNIDNDEKIYKLTSRTCYSGSEENLLTNTICQGAWNFEYLEWAKSYEEAQYFITDGPRKWIEYISDKPYARYDEIERYEEFGRVVELKRQDGLVVKLTKGAAYYLSHDHFEHVLCAGTWTNKTLSDENNEKLSSKGNIDWSN